MKVILSLFVFFNFVLNASAYCSTGYACSLFSMQAEAEKQFSEFSNNLNRYFSKQINEDFFFLKKPSELVYSDLFIFNTIV